MPTKQVKLNRVNKPKIQKKSRNTTINNIKNKNKITNIKTKSYKKKGILVHSVKTILYATGIGFILFGLLSKKLFNVVIDNNNLPKLLSPNEDNATITNDDNLKNLINDMFRSIINTEFDNYNIRKILTDYFNIDNLNQNIYIITIADYRNNLISEELINSYFKDKNISSIIINILNKVKSDNNIGNDKLIIDIFNEKIDDISSDLKKNIKEQINNFDIISSVSLEDNEIQLGLSLFGILLKTKLKININNNDIINSNNDYKRYFFKDDIDEDDPNNTLDYVINNINEEVSNILLKLVDVISLRIGGNTFIDVITDILSNTIKEYTDEAIVSENIVSIIQTDLSNKINSFITSDFFKTRMNNVNNKVSSITNYLSFINSINQYTEYFKIVFILLVSLLGIFLILKIVAEPYIGNKYVYKIILSFVSGPIQTILFLISIILVILYNKNLCKKTLPILGITEDTIEKFHILIKLNPAVILFLIGTVIFMLFNLYKTGYSLISLGVLIILLQQKIILSNKELYIPKSLTYGILPIVSGILLIIGNFLLNKTKK